MPHHPHVPTPMHHWIVDLAVERVAEIPAGRPLDRDAFYEWLWEHVDGLLGIDEGTVTVAEAVSQGLTPNPLVIDAAAAPVDRDWVAGLEVAAAACWFSEERVARTAARVLAAVPGCRVRGVRCATSCGTESWRDAFHAIHVPGFGSVRPAWEAGAAAAVPGQTTIFIEPGAGFGTGLHETTQLCLAAIAAWSRSGRRLGRVLDFGSGSGILGIAVAVCGAAHVDAVEIDERVHDAIAANARRNGVMERVRVAGRLEPAAEPYDLVLVNIVAPVLLEHAAALCGSVRRAGGGIVLSGLRAGDVGAVTDRYRSLLGREPEVEARADWHRVQFTLPDPAGR